MHDCAVIAVADERLGEVVGAVLATGAKAGAGRIDLRAVQRLNDVQQPRHFLAADELPLNAMGKIDKQEMRKRFGSGAPQPQGQSPANRRLNPDNSAGIGAFFSE